jgi:hypothetical protein
MRIGIITFWQSNDNYGQLLQCWALQQYLRSKDHDAYLIKYDLARRNKPKTLWENLLKALTIYPLIKYLLHRKEKQARNKIIAELNEKNKLRHFDDFRKNMLQISERDYHSLEELQSDPPVADVYITGSDQVWSQLLNNKENEVFFLNFGNSQVKRISYAASFGMDSYPTKLIKRLSINLRRFNAVSVREDSGVDICQNVGVESIKVLDPTMLLKGRDYLRFITIPKYNDYIYIYSLNISTPEQVYYEAITQYAQDEHLSIIVTPGSGRILGAEIFNHAIYDYATIPQWLSNIANAKMVITTSFHGTVFCILMNTPFVYVPLQGKLSNMNSRILGLLKELGLEDRAVENSYQMMSALNGKINWEEVMKKIRPLRDKSMLFIDNAITSKN